MLIVYIDYYYIKNWPKSISIIYIDHYCLKSDQQIYLYWLLLSQKWPKNGSIIYILITIVLKKWPINISSLITTVLKWPKYMLIVYIDYYCLENDQKSYLLYISTTIISKSDQIYISTNIYTSLHQIIYISRYQPNLINLDLTKQGFNLQRDHMTIRNDSTY